MYISPLDLMFDSDGITSSEGCPVSHNLPALPPQVGRNLEIPGEDEDLMGLPEQEGDVPEADGESLPRAEPPPRRRREQQLGSFEGSAADAKGVPISSAKISVLVC